MLVTARAPELREGALFEAADAIARSVKLVAKKGILLQLFRRD